MESEIVGDCRILIYTRVKLPIPREIDRLRRLHAPVQFEAEVDLVADRFPEASDPLYRSLSFWAYVS
jgi:hypothetical protein